MRIGKATLCAAAVSAALAGLGTSVHAQQGLQVQLSGQINRAIMAVDDGVQSDTFHVDNDNSSTRFRFLGSAPMTPGIRVGFLWEMEYQSNPSNAVNFAAPTGSPTLDERHIDLFFEGGWGKLSMGQGDGAANGAAEVDLSGTSVARYSDIGAVAGGFAFRTGAGAFGPTLASTISNQDFESRYDRLRYDTPTFAGFSLAGSVGQKADDVREIALRYSADLAGIGRLAAAIGYSIEDLAAFEDKTTGGSISWLHPSGINLTLARTEKELGAGREGKFTYGKLGYKIGRHAVSLDVGQGDDQAAVGDETRSVGLAYVFTPVAWAEVFAMATRATFDRAGTSFQDLDAGMIGTRLRF